MKIIIHLNEKINKIERKNWIETIKNWKKNRLFNETNQNS